MSYDFQKKMTQRFSEPELKYKSDMRWWMAAGMHTDETVKGEIRAMYEAGFSGVELCQLADRTIDGKIYGYGSAQWEHDVKLILNTALDLGMSVSLTSGAGWSTANVPGLDPDGQAANQCVMLIPEEIAAGQTRKGPLPTSPDLREKATFLGITAVPKAGDNVYYADGIVDLTEAVCDGALEWTAPEEGDYTLMCYYVQGTAQAASPAVETSYTINYFDRRGFEALKKYLEENVLNDGQIKEKIKAGDVQFFMDSLEYHHAKGITNWTETFAEEFKRRKGYEILPYLFLTKNAPSTSIWGWSDNADLIGTFTLTDRARTTRILNDIFDVQTKLYLEEFIRPFRAWLNAQGIRLRVQISYGKNLEISEPIASVDYPEAENRNQNNQVDMYRLWSGGAHLQNKVLSSETGGLDHSAYNYTYQRHLQEAYALYAAGYSRIVWHIWASEYGPKPVWPGYEGGDRKQIYYKFGTREPSYPAYCEFNRHLGRIQKLLRQGIPGMDLGMIYTKYGQHLVYTDAEDWMHSHRPMFFPSTALQDSGYTYDYFSPELLSSPEVRFDGTTKTLEPAGYKALVLWQRDLSVKGALTLLTLAKQGLPLIVVDGAAEASPYDGEDPEVLARLVKELKELDSTLCVPDADAVLKALNDRGITPRLSFRRANRQLLTQVRREGKDLYGYFYNYCDGSLHGEGEDDHGSLVLATVEAEGKYVPHIVNPWTGKVTKSAGYRYENGKTVFEVVLPYGDVALYALEGVEELPLHVEDPVPDLYFEKDGGIFCKYRGKGDFTLPLSDGRSVSVSSRTPTGFSIKNWSLTVASRTPTEEILTREETLLGVNTREYAVKTAVTTINTALDELKTWDEIEEIGKTVSGTGRYRATFQWDGEADGAELCFGEIVQSLQVWINGRKTDDINMNHPVVDVTDLLRKGENVIEMEYQSNLNNLQLSRGEIKEGVLPSNFLGYETKYESYGPRDAMILPYTLIRVADTEN